MVAVGCNSFTRNDGMAILHLRTLQDFVLIIPDGTTNITSLFNPKEGQSGNIKFVNGGGDIQYSRW